MADGNPRRLVSRPQVIFLSPDDTIAAGRGARANDVHKFTHRIQSRGSRIVNSLTLGPSRDCGFGTFLKLQWEMKRP
jgi:hypothetical protein